jgi:hypothetical protein
MASDDLGTVELLRASAADSRALWQPIVGEAGRSVIGKVQECERQQLETESVEVLSQCVPATQGSGERTGLVVGYVQSGKTLSFTAVSAIAHDNGFQLVIVIAGTSTQLLQQSTERLTDDLDARGFWGRWQLYRSDDSDLVNGNAEVIRAGLKRWRDPEVEEDEKKTLLITVMKEGTHLDRMIRILQQLDLSDVPALVIDDEADQASLNIHIRRGTESSTYRRIMSVRALLPLHTYLQYTATPQALLLINLIDQLSPDFGKVLTPGTAYTGGSVFFGGERGLVRRIPDADLPLRNVPLQQPPDSLKRAIQLFLVGVAAGIINRYKDAHNRSMMLHPAREVVPHAVYAHWVANMKDLWMTILERDATDRDRTDLLREFHDAYDDLTTTAQLPDFDAIVRKLPRAIRDTRVETVNSLSGSTQVIEWKRNYAWIVVGGQALDRGFTVEGLTVTYMPRSLGVGNADTVQQRARWFGYKANYLGLCRVFLSDAVINAFREYVEHEEDVRGRLSKHLERGLPLKQWKRAFLLSGSLSPTRKNVLGYDVARGNYADRWFSPRSPHASAAAVADNRRLIQAFTTPRTWMTWNDDSRLLNTHRHLVLKSPLREVYDQLLLDYSYRTPRDSIEYNGVLLQVSAYLKEHPEASCTVYIMRPSEITTRGTDDDGAEISQLFGGAWPVQGQPKLYPGDRELRHVGELTIQIHDINVYQGPVSAGILTMENVPVLAAWLPADYSAPWLVQEQNVSE